MGLVASDAGGGDFKKVPTGAHIGRCYSVIDLGTQLVNGQYGEKNYHKLKISWELWGEDENGDPLVIEKDGVTKPMTISKDYTVSLHEKAGLRKDLASWRGRDFTDEEVKGFEVDKLLGAYGMVNVTHSETNGKTYANVAGLTPIPAALKNSKPAPVHALVKFDLDAPDMDVWEAFNDKLKEKILKSPESKSIKGSKPASEPEGGSFDDVDDDLPY